MFNKVQDLLYSLINQEYWEHIINNYSLADTISSSFKGAPVWSKSLKTLNLKYLHRSSDAHEIEKSAI
jgi:hypothetical protein